MDGTLLDLHYDNFFWHQQLPSIYANLHGLSIEATRKKLISTFESKTGTLTFYCTDFWSNELGIDIIALKREANQKIQFLPYAENLLTQTRQLTHGPQLVIATNAHRDVFNVKDQKLTLSSRVDSVYCANELGHPKEDQAYWSALQQHLRFNPKKTLLIDDNQTVLSSARTFGIAHLLLPLKPDSQRAAQNQQIDCGAIHCLSDLFADNQLII